MPRPDRALSSGRSGKRKRSSLWARQEYRAIEANDGSACTQWNQERTPQNASTPFHEVTCCANRSN